MKTEVIMKRELFGREISQKSKSEFFSATDLVKAGNLWRLENDKDLFKLQTWMQNKSTKEFIAELEKEYGNVIIRSRGKNQHTWMHPFLIIDLALAIDPKLKIEVYKWLYDELLKYRNSSGDSYKRMTGALYINSSNKRFYTNEVKEAARAIKYACSVDSWETASESQLKLRDKIHENIALLCDVLKRNDDAVRIGIKKALDGVNNG
jgi:hypothetical protein